MHRLLGRVKTPCTNGAWAPDSFMLPPAPVCPITHRTCSLLYLIPLVLFGVLCISWIFSLALDIHIACIRVIKMSLLLYIHGVSSNPVSRILVVENNAWSRSGFLRGRSHQNEIM